MTTPIVYVQGADLPDLTLSWRSAGALIDFSSGWTFELKVGNPGEAAALTKNTGITGAATDPNITIAWSTSGELNTLPAGSYIAQLRAQRTADSKHRFMRFTLKVEAAVT